MAEIARLNGRNVLVATLSQPILKIAFKTAVPCGHFLGPFFFGACANGVYRALSWKGLEDEARVCPYPIIAGVISYDIL